MPNNTFTPINRNNLFYDEKEFNFETETVMDYIEEDLNQTIVVYPVDREKTQINSISQSAVNGIRFKNPIEIPCQYEIQDSELKSFDKKTSNGVYALNGPLTAYVMPKILEKYNCEISRGDYIGVYVDEGRMVYFVVTDDGKVNTSNKNHIGAYRLAWRVIKATPSSDYEFKGE